MKSSFIIVRLKNRKGYSISSEQAKLIILNKDQIDGSTTAQPVVDPALLPSRPKIEQVAYAFKSLFIKWTLESNGGSDINQITVSILKYGLNGPTNAYKQSNFQNIFIISLVY